MKSIKQQIKEQLKLHVSMFACWGFAIIYFILAFIVNSPECISSGNSFLAASFVIGAIIDVNENKS